MLKDELNPNLNPQLHRHSLYALLQAGRGRGNRKANACAGGAARPAAVGRGSGQRRVPDGAAGPVRQRVPLDGGAPSRTGCRSDSSHTGPIVCRWPLRWRTVFGRPCIRPFRCVGLCGGVYALFVSYLYRHIM